MYKTMITPKVTETKVVFGPCRLSYAHLFTKFAPDGGEGKYQTNVLIPKEETETVNAIKQAIDAAKKKGIIESWGGKEPKKLELPLRDGDAKDPTDEVYAGHYFINPKSSRPVSITDKNGAPIVDEEEMYSGVYAFVSVTFKAYEKNGNRGVTCFLNAVRKFKDGERLGGAGSADADFDGIDMEDDDDL